MDPVPLLPPPPAEGVPAGARKAAIRRALQAAFALIAPEVDFSALKPERPLRDQVELDSLDWLNLAAELQLSLQCAVPPAALGPQATPETLVAALMAAPAAPTGKAPVEPAPGAAGAELPCFEAQLGAERVSVRPIRPEDAPLEAAFVRELSSEARYKRFMGTLLELPEAKLKYLTEVDQQRHVALVATSARDGAERIVGVARYVVDATDRRCEFAVTVGDRWLGTGLAGVLMHALMALARARGLREMEGFVLAANRPMLKFARQLGFRLAPLADDPRTVHALRAL